MYAHKMYIYLDTRKNRSRVDSLLAQPLLFIRICRMIWTYAMYYIPRYHGNRRLRNLISARSPELLS